MSKSKSNKRWKKVEPKADPRMGLPSLSALVLLSGFASLVYQILWMRHLGLLFGNGSQAAAATLAMFFAGLGAGSWWWGRHLSTKPLRLYSLLELGIAACAIGYFLIRLIIAAIYPSIYAWAAGTPWMLAAKLLMAGLLIFPAAFFMGGTIPAMTQVAVGARSRFGSVSAWLYGINTLGATLGVVMGAFVLLPSFGFRISYGIAVLCSVLVAAWAWQGAKAETSPEENRQFDDASGKLDPRIGGLAFISGFVVLGLEVAWTRVFAQVHENSVYSFAVILSVVLMGLALGSWISSLLSRLNKSPQQLLGWILLVSGGLIILGPVMLMAATKDLQPVSTIESWGDYLADIFRMGIGGIGFTVIALGVVFPFLMKMVENEVAIPGRMLGQLLAINTLGAILGSLVCGFILLPMLGMWDAIKWLAILHLLAASFLTLGWGKLAVLRSSLLCLMVICFCVFKFVSLPLLSLLPGEIPFKILEAWEENGCTVVAVETEDGHQAIMINASYTLGSTSAYVEQVRQSQIPLYLYPETRSICFIGVGTGISVGASLDKERFPNIERVLACELTPAVIEAAEKWIPDRFQGGLFSDERCEILAEDGRNHLMATRERFDMINADLFTPYRRGVGSLYSLDHYEVVAERLNEGGVFVQWLPMYQLTEFEFGVIANTMMQAFDEVTMWRNNFTPGKEKVALIARAKSGSIPVPPVMNREEMREAVMGLDWRNAAPEMRVERESLPFFYGGNLSAARQLFTDFPLNTDNHPIIEFQTPWRFREVAAKDQVIWCVGPKLTKWMERVFDLVAPSKDPLLNNHPSRSECMVQAGMAFHQAMVSRELRDNHQADLYWEHFQRHWIRAAGDQVEQNQNHD